MLLDAYNDEVSCTLKGGRAAHPAMIEGGGVDAVLVWKAQGCYVLSSMVRSGQRRLKLAISAFMVLAVFVYLGATFKVNLQEVTLVRRKESA